MPAAPGPSLPSPADPSPRWYPLRLQMPEGHVVVAQDDGYSDRIRCDHPTTEDPPALAQRLIEAAEERRRGRVTVFASAKMRGGFGPTPLVREATMPGYYTGRDDCDVWRLAIDPARGQLKEPKAVLEVDQLIANPRPGRKRPRIFSERATEDDAPAIAALVTATFEHYPTPTGVPDYVRTHIAEGTPFRIVREGKDVVACASADLVRLACTAELTDCATRPDQRGRGLMQAVLSDLMDDLRDMRYPTAFTLARASIAGVNLAFQRLGFEYRGCMVNSCRIGGGIEDMNVWSRTL